MHSDAENMIRLIRVGHGSSRFADNTIKTTKYTWYNFLAYNLMGQMMTPSNIYFFV